MFGPVHVESLVVRAVSPKAVDGIQSLTFQS